MYKEGHVWFQKIKTARELRWDIWLFRITRTKKKKGTIVEYGSQKIYCEATVNIAIIPLNKYLMDILKSGQ